MRRGWTLAEVMVVVTIVSGLIALSSPLLIDVLHAGTRTRCAGHQHQIGHCLHRYAEEHADQYPAEGNCGDTNPETSPAWWYRLPLYADGMTVSERNSIFQCPGFEHFDPQHFDHASPKSYKMNAHLDSGGRPHHYRRGRFRGEAEYVCLVDAIAGETGMGQWGHCFPSAVDDSRHPDAVNVLFLDLHVESVGTPEDEDEDGHPDWHKALKWRPSQHHR
jgi:prepilin-type processing-associated H-X9-DG protein/prepilin-type N-terminal cleavage/methylation domain-containing protein